MHRHSRLLLALLPSPSSRSPAAAADDEAGRRRPRAASGEALRVGLIVDQGQLDDNGFNELAFAA